ncbi:MAG: BTAD domain-containing putative transcriptional regulator [Longimicrobiales bacterium]|nr:BTAD domain-containing putative transcriptional regulator [Longimicrobiales bacterium]
MLHLKLFGGASLEDEDQVLTGPVAQRHRLALLSLLAIAPSRGRIREKIVGLLWPDRDGAGARKLLNQSVYVLRKRLGEDTVISVGDELRLGAESLSCDVVAFEEALRDGRTEAAIALYAGPFLDGFFLDGAPAFQRWTERERRRLAAEYAAALERLAEAAEGEGRVREAVRWWRVRATHDPYDSRIIVRLMRALTSSGNPAGALRHAAIHERLLTEDLGIELPREVGALVRRLRSRPPERATEERPDASLGSPAVETEEDGQDANLSRPARSRRSRLPSTAAGSDARPEVERGGGWLRPLTILGAATLLLTIWLVTTRPSTQRPDPAGSTGEERAIPADPRVETVVEEAQRRRSGDDPARLPEQRTTSIEAYELYRRGTDPRLLRSAEDARRAFEDLRQAVALDSTYAAAWAQLACLALRVSMDNGTGLLRSELHALAGEAARRSVRLDDALAEGHAALGLVAMTGFDFQAAEEHLRRAVELDGTLTRPREWLVGVYLWRGEPERALATAREARALNPVSPTANAEVARALAANDRCDEALHYAEELLRLRPPLLRAAPVAARCHLLNRTWDEAIEVLRPQADPARDLYSTAFLGHVLARAGRREEALGIRTDLLDRAAREGTGALPLAIVDLGLGRMDDAVVGLHRAVEDGSLSGLPVHASILDAILEPALGDPRIQQLLERIGHYAA